MPGVGGQAPGQGQPEAPGRSGDEGGSVLCHASDGTEAALRPHRAQDRFRAGRSPRSRGGGGRVGPADVGAPPVSAGGLRGGGGGGGGAGARRARPSGGGAGGPRGGRRGGAEG